MAPPTPTTTPITVVLVLGDIVEDETSFWPSDAVLLDAEDDEVCEEVESLVGLPPATTCVVVATL